MFPDIKLNFTRVDWLIADFVKKDKPTFADFMYVKKMGSFFDTLDKYRISASNMSMEDLQTEKHKSSRLARHMTRAGDPRPSPRCDCHALISGAHGDAVLLRAMLAWFLLRIDDPFNGCWLPRDWQDRAYMPNYLRMAVPHCRIHHGEYYRWLYSRIQISRVKTADQLINELRMIRVMLQAGNVPESVMPKTGRS